LNSAWLTPEFTQSPSTIPLGTPSYSHGRHRCLGVTAPRTSQISTRLSLRGRDRLGSSYLSRMFVEQTVQKDRVLQSKDNAQDLKAGRAALCPRQILGFLAGLVRTPVIPAIQEAETGKSASLGWGCGSSGRALGSSLSVCLFVSLSTGA
jgi:hypothetical protein